MNVCVSGCGIEEGINPLFLGCDVFKSIWTMAKQCFQLILQICLIICVFWLLGGSKKELLLFLYHLTRQFVGHM